ncbi:MAG: hypothetical protein JXA44_10480 [Methanospirillaceae archaeon]|nr:hypothetical protein [Methanospirillaceae archaeon]
MSDHYLKISALVILSFLLFGSGICTATPPLPCEFYGGVFINDIPAPAGTKITALINGIDHGEIITENDGFYGGPALFDRRLTVAATEDELGSGIGTIIFQINGMPARETAEYIPGLSQELLLTTGGVNTNPDMPVSPTAVSTIPYQPTPPPGSGFESATTYIADDGQARLLFDAGSQILDKGVAIDQVEIIRTDSAMLPPMSESLQETFTGYGYRIVPDGAVFIPEATFIISVPPGELQDYVSNFAVLKLFSPATGGWQDQNTAINTNAGEVHSTVTWSTAYALFVQETGQNKNLPGDPAQGSKPDTMQEPGTSMVLPPLPPAGTTPVAQQPDKSPGAVMPLNTPDAIASPAPVVEDGHEDIPQSGDAGFFFDFRKSIDTLKNQTSGIIDKLKAGMYSLQERLFSPAGYILLLLLFIAIGNLVIYRCYQLRCRK